MDTFGSVMHRNWSASKKRQQHDTYAESCAPKKKRKENPVITNVCPLGELARHEERRYVLLLSQECKSMKLQ
jgi:hypothetical protein